MYKSGMGPVTSRVSSKACLVATTLRPPSATSIFTSTYSIRYEYHILVHGVQYPYASCNDHDCDKSSGKHLTNLPNPVSSFSYVHEHKKLNGSLDKC